MLNGKFLYVSYTSWLKQFFFPKNQKGHNSNLLVVELSKTVYPYLMQMWQTNY